MSDFSAAVEYTLAVEGGFVNNPLDKGGATNFGITASELSRYLGREVTVDEVQNLPRQTAISVYEKFYWTPLRLGEVQSQMIATAIFDIGVNRGQMAAGRYAQAAAGLKVIDGIIGGATIAALNSTDEKKFIVKFLHSVKTGYVNICKSNESQLEFLDGWLERALRLLSLIEGLT
jgi:lysozyme family protein